MQAPVPDQLSPVSTLCLAILNQCDATGYEIKKASTEEEYRWFIEASFGAIYPALARLAADEMVTLREEVQAGKPARKVYSITQKGRAALLTALSSLPGPDIFRSRFLLMAQIAQDLPRPLIEEALAERRRILGEEIAHLRELAGEDGQTVGMNWIADYGQACLQASLDFLDARGDELIASAKPPLSDAAE